MVLSMPQTNYYNRRWRGTRENYEFLSKLNQLDQWTRYSVIEPDKTITEYFGSNLINEPTGQFLPVKSVIESVDNIEPAPYDRYLVGTDNNGYNIYTYQPDSDGGLTLHVKEFKTGMSVRVQDRYFKNYVLTEGRLLTYDDVNCGTF